MFKYTYLSLVTHSLVIMDVKGMMRVSDAARKPRPDKPTGIQSCCGSFQVPPP